MRFSRLERIASAVVEATQQKLPPEIRELARAVPVLHQASPDESVLAEGFDTDLLGLFAGTPFDAEVSQFQPDPPHIIIYINNIWDYAAANEADFRAEVRLTYLHELGHYFGWDEGQLAARGLD